MAHRTRTALTTFATIGLFLALAASASTASATTADCKTNLTQAHGSNEVAIAADRAMGEGAAAANNTGTTDALASAAISCLGQKLVLQRHFVISPVQL